MAFTVFSFFVLGCNKSSEEVSQKQENKFKTNKFSAELLASVGENEQTIAITKNCFQLLKHFLKS